MGLLDIFIIPPYNFRGERGYLALETGIFLSLCFVIEVCVIFFFLSPLLADGECL